MYYDENMEETTEVDFISKREIAKGFKYHSISPKDKGRIYFGHTSTGFTKKFKSIYKNFTISRSIEKSDYVLVSDNFLDNFCNRFYQKRDGAYMDWEDSEFVNYDSDVITGCLDYNNSKSFKHIKDILDMKVVSISSLDFGGVKLDDEQYEKIQSMVLSKDKELVTLGEKLLQSCDVSCLPRVSAIASLFTTVTDNDMLFSGSNYLGYMLVYSSNIGECLTSIATYSHDKMIVASLNRAIKHHLREDDVYTDSIEISVKKI